MKTILQIARYRTLAISLVLLSIVLYSREFSGPDGPPSQLFSKLAFDIRLVDIILVSWSFLMIGKYLSLKKLNKLWGAIDNYIYAPLLMFFAAIFISLVYGFIKGGNELFFEWRAILLGLMLAIAFRTVIKYNLLYQTAYAVFFLISFHSLVLLVKWIWFGGVPPYNGPVFDGPTLSNAVAGVSLGTALLYMHRHKLFSLFFILSNVILVITAFRRTYWAEFLIVIAIIFFLYKRTRYYIGTALIVSLLALSMLVPSDFVNAIIARINSIGNFYDVSNPYASTNIGHVEDVMDAILQIKNSPILGIGLGTSYQTYYTSWKLESWGVHNGPLHVWLRFGFLGLFAYLWFHWRVLKFLWIYRKLRLVIALLSYWIAIFIPPLFFSPWPYGALQNTVLLAVLFALVDAEVTYWSYSFKKFPS